jgi:O-antigen ligase
VSVTDLVEDVRARGSSAVASSRPSRWLELGLGLVVIAVPLALLPASFAPFVDVKLVLLLAGALAVWAGSRKRSVLALPAAFWVGTLALAGLLGVDRWWSLVGPERTGNGILLLGTSAFLLVAATGVPNSIRARIPLWLVWTSVGVALVSLVYRLWPAGVALVVPRLSFEGGTLGHPVYLAGFMAIGVVATVGLNRLGPRLLVPSLVIMSTALALSTKRVGWIALAVGLGVALWRARPPRRRGFLIVGVVTATLAGWSLVDVFVSPEAPLSGARRFGELTTDSARARVTSLPAMGRSWVRRPVLGWGPGNVWGAYVSSAAESELRVAGRGLGDAHNVFVEAAVTTGALGMVALLGLVGFSVRELRKGSRSLGWAAGAAAGLGVYHLIQPNNVALTPLLFLLAGLACPLPPEGRLPEETSPAESGSSSPILVRRALRMAGRGSLGLLMAGSLFMASGVLVASILEQYGRTYASEWAMRTSLRFAPRRVTVAEALALSLALDGRSGDREAGREAAELAERIVRLHPWNPGVRLVAADVHVLLRDPEAAYAWVERHLARFPEDVIPVLPPEDLTRPPPVATRP